MSKIPILKVGQEIDFHQLFDIGIYGLPADAIFINGPEKFKNNGIILIENTFDSNQNKLIIHTLFSDDAGIFVEVYNFKEQKWSDWVTSNSSGDGAVKQLWECSDGSVTASTEYDAKTKTFKTKISAKGTKGDKGDPGQIGPQGERGPPGEKGAQGDTGPQGPKGEQGISGKDGEPGPKGDKGDRGETGPQGERGLQGIKGDKGDQGVPGPAGKDGESGDNTKLPVYEFVYGKGYSIEYNKELIPAVTTIDIKKPFPSKEIIVSLAAILDSYYDAFKYMIFAISLGTTTIKVDGTEISVARDLLTYVRVPIEVAKLPTALYVSTDYLAFRIDVTKLFNNIDSWNYNQKLIRITASSYNEKGYMSIPSVIDDSNPSSTAWHKTNKIGTAGLITLASQMFFNYDGRQVNFGNGTVEFIIDMQSNIFSDNFVKYLIFKGDTTTVIPSHKLRLTIKANSIYKVTTSNPYSILNKKEYNFDFILSNSADNVRNQVVVTLICQNGSMLLTAFQF